MIVCICNNISDRTIRQAVNSGIDTMPQLRERLGLGTCCGKCHCHAKQVLRDCRDALREQAQPLVFHANPLAA